MVIGGFTDDYQTDYQKQTEVIDLTDSSLTCTSAFGELESVRRYAMGGLINEAPILCGGRDSNNEVYDSCIVFSQTKTSIKMYEPRFLAASVVLNETTLWLLGGFDGGFSTLRSTELITMDAATSVKGPALPDVLSEFCVVKYNDTHIYLTGGNVGSNYLNQVSTNEVWIHNTILDAGSSSWTEGPRMNTGRRDHGCTVLHHGQNSWVVVAGAWRHSDTTSVEILDPNNNKWIQG